MALPSSQSMKNFSSLVLAVFALSAACSRTRADTSAIDSRKAVSSPEPVATDAGPNPKSTCPRTGQWARCSVEKRLEQSGFVVKADTGDAPQRAGFSVRPLAYTLGKSHLEIFLYSSPDAAARDVARLDTAIAAPRGATPAWQIPPTFVRSANLIGVFLTESAVQAERLSLALSAGAPQP